MDENDNAFLSDVPGPLAPLLGIRIDEWDAREAGVTNPVLLSDGTVSRAHLVFELVQPLSAEIVGTYQDDFYAGTPAVTRNAFGAGHGWHVGAGLDDIGVTWVVRQVLDSHDLLGPCADLDGVEVTTRHRPDGAAVTFVLNHCDKPVDIAAPVTGVDLLTQVQLVEGDLVRLDPLAVLVIHVAA